MLDAARALIPSGMWTALKHREQLFVAAYLADPRMRGEAAAIAAGYAEKAAGSSATKILRKPTVRAAVAAAQEARVRRIEVDADRVLTEVDTLSLSCVTDYQMTEDGFVEPADGRSPEVMRAIKSIKRRVRFVKNPEGGFDREIETEFTLWDKPGTLRLSMQHRGMLVEKHEVKLPPGSGVLAVPVAPTAAQWGAMAAAQQDGLRGAKDAVT
jgi:phage terminase small subunit